VRVADVFNLIIGLGSYLLLIRFYSPILPRWRINLGKEKNAFMEILKDIVEFSPAGIEKNQLPWLQHVEEADENIVRMDCLMMIIWKLNIHQ
jgi:accessory gene regulator protein AgrB